MHTRDFKDRFFKHYSRGTYYQVLCVGLFKSSNDTHLDETMIVTYTDIDGNPHHRPFRDFFGTVHHEGMLVNRFQEVKDSNEIASAYVQ